MDTPALVFVAAAFFASGSLFLIFPEQHYTTDWAVYIKYIILVIGILIASLSGAVSQKLYVEHLLLAAWITALFSAAAVGAEILRVALYGLPAICLLLPSRTRIYLPSLAFYVLILALLGAIYEALVTGGFATFADLGYRASSIFLNPNNMAIAAVLLFSYSTQRDSRITTAIGFSVCAALVILSASKAGMALFASLIIWHSWIRNPKLALAASGAVFGIVLLGLSLDWFRAPYLSVYFRLEQILSFVRGIENPIFPFAAQGGGGQAYVDNVYLQTWNEMGLPAAAVLVAVIGYVALRDRMRTPLWLMFGMAGLSENFIYLWPLAYLFWTYVGAERRGLVVVQESSPSNALLNRPERTTKIS